MNAIVSHPNAFWLANKIYLSLGEQEFLLPSKSSSVSCRKNIRCDKTLSRVKNKGKESIAVAQTHQLIAYSGSHNTAFFCYYNYVVYM